MENSNTAFLEGRVMITQNDTSLLIDDSKQIQIHYLENGEPNMFMCSPLHIIQGFKKRWENESENATVISFPNSDSKTT